MHQNPVLMHIPDVSYVYSQPFDIGAYTVTRDLAAEAARMRLPVLPDEAALNFTSSPLSYYGWRSVGRGWLFRSYSGWGAPAYSNGNGLLDTLANVVQAAMCEIGSMRIELETFAAPVVTAIGLRTGTTIGLADFQGARMGLVASGKKTVSEIIQPEVDSLTFSTWVVRIFVIAVAVIVDWVYVECATPRNGLIAGEILLGIAIACWQWSNSIGTAICGFAGAACITAGFVGTVQSAAKEREERAWRKSRDV
jgi:hypothetical protein